MIRPCSESDFHTICTIINEAAQVYKGVIPADRWHEPYMPEEELRREIRQGVHFWGYEQNGELSGVMGLQDVKDVTLIRHAYVLPTQQKCGIGGKLLASLCRQTDRPVLIGAWKDAVWAVSFYQKHGFQLVSPAMKNRLLTTYWSVTPRQIETSVVLAQEPAFLTPT